MEESKLQEIMQDKDVQNMMMGIFQQQMKANQESKAVEYGLRNGYVKEGQVLFAGSSLMENFPIAEFQSEYDLNGKIIYNRGIGGYVMEQFEAHLEECVFGVKAGRMFLNIGTNDLSQDDFELSAFMKHYESVLDKIVVRCPDMEIYLMAYYPVNINCVQNDYMRHAIENRSNELIHTVNVEIEKMAERKGMRFINVNRNLFDDEGNQKKEFCMDGMHLNANGYHAIMDDLIPYVTEPAWK